MEMSFVLIIMDHWTDSNDKRTEIIVQMATRNLTPEFNKYRQGSGRKRQINGATSASTSLIGGEMYSLFSTKW